MHVSSYIMLYIVPPPGTGPVAMVTFLVPWPVAMVIVNADSQFLLIISFIHNELSLDNFKA